LGPHRSVNSSHRSTAPLPHPTRLLGLTLSETGRLLTQCRLLRLLEQQLPQLQQLQTSLPLYSRCVSSGLKARINISNNAGLQEITLTCQLSAAVAITRGRRRRRTRRRCQANKDAAPSLPRVQSSQPVPAVPPPTRPEPPPPDPQPPELSPPEPPPTPLAATCKAREKGGQKKM
jgi:hypothetical protein